MMTFCCLYCSLVHELRGGCNQKKILQFRGRTGIEIQETRTTAKRFKVESQLEKKQKFHRVNTGFGTGVKQRGLEHDNLTRPSAGFVTQICCNLMFWWMIPMDSGMRIQNHVVLPTGTNTEKICHQTWDHFRDIPFFRGPTASKAMGSAAAAATESSTEVCQNTQQR
jgi:hypothetical protein